MSKFKTPDNRDKDGKYQYDAQGKPIDQTKLHDLNGNRVEDSNRFQSDVSEDEDSESLLTKARKAILGF